jgi:hypothetical protein
MLTLLLAGCAAQPEFQRPDPAQTADARERLAEAAERGPVRLEVIGAPSGFTADQIASLAAEGVPALDVRFAADGPPAPRLVLAFGKTAPELVCAGRVNEAEPTSPARLTAAFCDERGLIAGVTGRAGGPNVTDTRRLIWRTTARLFPDNYAETYGFNLFGNRIRLGLGGSFGF